MTSSKNILLIGFMGVGKSTLARMLSKELNRVSIDTDKIIENMQDRKIKKIFKEDGEDYFRELEKKAALWLETSVQNTIISTGGGFIYSGDLKKIGTVIYLKSSYDKIISRINKHPKAKSKFEKRPLLKDAKKAKELFNKREKDYQKSADIVFDVGKYESEEETMKELINILQNYDNLQQDAI